MPVQLFAGADRWNHLPIASSLAHLGSPTGEPLQILLLAAPGLAYWRRARTLAGGAAAVPVARQLSFAAGLGLAALALISPLDHLAEELLSAHMAQHLLLADLAALLIVLGLTGPLLAPLLGLRPLRWLRAFAHPAVALPLWALDLWLWHLPAAYEAALRVPALHALEHACFLGFGILMWMPLVGPLPMPRWFDNPARVAYVLAVRVGAAALANVLLFAGVVLYPSYRTGSAEWDLSALTDQRIAGGIMLLEAAVLTLALLAWLAARTLRQAERTQRLLDLAAERGVALDPERARRAVAGGGEALLRERIGAR